MSGSTKTIDTLLTDINNLLKVEKCSLLPNKENFQKFGVNVSLAVLKQIASDPKVRPEGTVYASELGTQCLRQFNYKVRHPELAAPLPGAARFKFIYGNIIEELVLLLAREAGHRVEYEQEPVQFTDNPITIAGRIDAVIDGVIVDVKSASPHSFNKMAGRHNWPDAFGYKSQLLFYEGALDLYKHDSKQESKFLLVNKVTGQLGFATHGLSIPKDFWAILDAARALRQAADDDLTGLRKRPNKIHSRGLVLDPICSYCAFKKDCWKNANDGAGIRWFKYSNGILPFVAINKDALSDEGFTSREVKLYDKKEEFPAPAENEEEEEPSLPIG